jgi:hypothetical protein
MVARWWEVIVFPPRSEPEVQDAGDHEGRPYGSLLDEPAVAVEDERMSNSFSCNRELQPCRLWQLCCLRKFAGRPFPLAMYQQFLG